MYFRIIAIVVAALSLSGCEEPPFPYTKIPLAPDARGKVGSIEVVVAQFQSPIYASAMPAPGTNLATGISSGLGKGLLMERVDLVNKALATFNYGNDTLQATQQAFAGIDSARIRVSPKVARSSEEWDAAFNASTADAVLFFYIHYSIGGEQRPLQFVGALNLRPKSQALLQARAQSKSPDELVIYRSHKTLTRYFMGADSPTRVRSEFDVAARELAAWAATEASALVK